MAGEYWLSDRAWAAIESLLSSNQRERPLNPT